MIRTFEMAQKEDLMSYYRSTCEHCHNEYVMSNNDLNAYFFGQPKIENDESMWKCPECGHVNVLKTKDLVPCYQSGSTAIKFELNDEETQKILEFKKLHNHSKEGLLPHIKSIQQFTYSLTNYGAGYHIKIKCNECGEEKELC